MQVIRKIVNGKPDQFWTGKKFDSDINRAMEIKGSRHAAIEKRKALRLLNNGKPDMSKNEKVVHTHGYSDATKDKEFVDSYESKRNLKTKSEYVNTSLLKPDGNLDPSKVSDYAQQKSEEKRLEVSQKKTHNVTHDRVVSPVKKK